MPSRNVLRPRSRAVAQPQATTEPVWIQRLLIGSALVFLAFFLVLPLVAVFVQAFHQGVVAYVEALRQPDALAAMLLTLLAAAMAVPLNVLFGVAAAWAISKFEFVGKSLLMTCIDIPFAVSPVISGLIFVLLFGLQGWLGPWLSAHDLTGLGRFSGSRSSTGV
jgi:sulfate transport system permease protein